MGFDAGLAQYQNSWQSGSTTESSRKVIYWTAAAIAVPIAGAIIWWVTEKSINTIAPYQVSNFVARTESIRRILHIQTTTAGWWVRQRAWAPSTCMRAACWTFPNLLNSILCLMRRPICQQPQHGFTRHLVVWAHLITMSLHYEAVSWSYFTMCELSSRTV